MNTINRHTHSTYREKGSKFLGFLFPAASHEAFEGELEAVRKEHPTATHHCYGWRIGPNHLEEFAQDDGEPSGTAGLPILNQLRSYEVVNAGLVVVRYYGGTKLGKAGLIEAYGLSARLCLDTARLQAIRKTENFRVYYPYAEQNLVELWKNRYGLVELESEYLESVTLLLACPAETADTFRHELQMHEHRDITYEEEGSDFIAAGNTK